MTLRDGNFNTAQVQISKVVSYRWNSEELGFFIESVVRTTRAYYTMLTNSLPTLNHCLLVTQSTLNLEGTLVSAAFRLQLLLEGKDFCNCSRARSGDTMLVCPRALNFSHK